MDSTLADPPPSEAVHLKFSLVLKHMSDNCISLLVLQERYAQTPSGPTPHPLQMAYKGQNWELSYVAPPPPPFQNTVYVDGDVKCF